MNGEKSFELLAGVPWTGPFLPHAPPPRVPFHPQLTTAKKGSLPCRQNVRVGGVGKSIAQAERMEKSSSLGKGEAISKGGAVASD